jgi:hypothetical protein
MHTVSKETISLSKERILTSNWTQNLWSRLRGDHLRVGLTQEITALLKVLSTEISLKLGQWLKLIRLENQCNNASWNLSQWLTLLKGIKLILEICKQWWILRIRLQSLITWQRLKCSKTTWKSSKRGLKFRKKPWDSTTMPWPKPIKNSKTLAIANTAQWPVIANLWKKQGPLRVSEWMSTGLILNEKTCYFK